MPNRKPKKLSPEEKKKKKQLQKELAKLGGYGLNLPLSPEAQAKANATRELSIKNGTWFNVGKTNLKMSVEKQQEYFISVVNWINEEPTAITLRDYWLDKDTDKTYSYWTVRNYLESRPEFKEIKAYLKHILEQKIVKNALNRNYDPTFAKFCLKVNHGWVEKNETELTIKDDTIKFNFGSDITDAEIIKPEDND